MNFTLHQLQIFLKLVEHQSVTKAADELFLTQPAVSIQLKNLQSQFSLPLTEVVGRQLYVTDFGHELAESARNILDEVDAINFKAASFDGKLSGRIKISIVSTAKYVMPYFLSEFIRLHADVDLNIDVTNKTHVVQSLHDNAVDFAMVSVLPPKLKLERVELMQNKLYLVGGTSINRPKNWSAKKTIENNPIFFREQGSATRAAMERFLRAKKISTYKKIELTSNEALKQALIAGLGYSIMPLIGIKNELKSGDLEIIPMKGLPIITHWNLVWLKGKKLSTAATALLEHIEQHKSRIIKEQFDWFEKY